MRRPLRAAAPSGPPAQTARCFRRTLLAYEVYRGVSTTMSATIRPLNAVGLHASKQRLVSPPKKSSAVICRKNESLLLKTTRFRRPGRSAVVVTRSMLHEAVTVTERDVGGGKGLMVTQNIPKGTVVWWEVSRSRSPRL